MADISKIAYILSNASPEVLTALRNIVYAIQDISTSGGGLSPTGSDIGATAQVQVFFQGVKTDGIVDASNEYNIISSDGAIVLIGSVDTDAKVVAPNKVLSLGDPDNEGNGTSVNIDDDNERIEINAPDVISLNGTDLPNVTITAANLLSPTFELVIEKGFVKTFTP